MPKQNRHDQADIWSADQFEQVMEELSPTMRSLFSICYYTGCRVSEARQLRAEDVVGETLVLRKATTKTKRTRAVPIHPKLKAVLEAAELPSSGYLFPGRSGEGPITRQACDLALRKACDLLSPLAKICRARSELIPPSAAPIPANPIAAIPQLHRLPLSGTPQGKGLSSRTARRALAARRGFRGWPIISTH